MLIQSSFKQKIIRISLAVSLGALSGCGQEPVAKKPAGFAPAEGQVNVIDTNPSNVSAFAAARFLEQASWGPTPQAIAEVQRLGMEGWINRQLSLPPTTLNAPNYVIDYDDQNNAQRDLAWDWVTRKFLDVHSSGQDQLRLRTTWALFNFIPLSIQLYGEVEYFNMLQRNAFKPYSTLLYEVSVNPSMGKFLNNDQNEAQRPNENYGRELMQLFSVGLVLLNPDGSVRRDASGSPIETYKQPDVIASTRALSGWQTVWEGSRLPNTNYGNFGKRMVPKGWDGAHDKGEKKLLGKTIPAGQSPEQDLRSLINILVTHPNAAPFVSQRLIQSLTTSNPSAAYMSRVSAVFTQTNGNLGEVVKAILLDPEARAGDDPKVYQTTQFGRIKEPLLHHMSVLRGLGCTSAIMVSWRDGEPKRPLNAYTQQAHSAPDVFGFVSPSFIPPGSNMLAPEQRLIDRREFNRRLDTLNGLNRDNGEGAKDAGCEVDAFLNAFRQSNDAFLTLVSERFFKGAMPTVLRHGASETIDSITWGTEFERMQSVLDLLLSSPSFGVVK